MRNLMYLGLFAILVLDYSNCNKVNFNTSEKNGIFGNPICDPFGGGSGPTTSSNGILGSLNYIPNNSPRVPSDSLTLADFNSGKPDVVEVANTVVLSQFNVRTHDFNFGFTDTGNSTVKDINGNVLVEFFALFTHGLLMLNNNDTDGDYQFGLLADDGSELFIGDRNDKMIENDGVHSNTFACSPSASPVSLRKGEPIPFKLNYFQGPRVRISLMLLWRKNSDIGINEPECGVKREDSYYFTHNSSGEPVATAKFNALLNRGWKVIPAANFYLPGNNQNPCN